MDGSAGSAMYMRCMAAVFECERRGGWRAVCVGCGLACWRASRISRWEFLRTTEILRLGAVSLRVCGGRAGQSWAARWKLHISNTSTTLSHALEQATTFERCVHNLRYQPCSSSSSSLVCGPSPRPRNLASSTTCSTAEDTSNSSSSRPM